MTILEFLSDRLASLLIQAAFAAVTFLFLLATGTQAGILYLLCVVWFLALLCAQVIDFFRLSSRLQELNQIMENLDQKYLFYECIPKGRNIYERRLTDLFRRAGKSMIGAVSDAQAAQKEYREYVESWVHEIKTPITAAGLICRNAEPDTRRKLSPELAQIEAHVERALFYARAESPEKDFILRQNELSVIVAQAMGQHKALLIQNGVRVETSGLAQTVYTDGKWAAFILGQLLQNAVRYRSMDSTPVIILFAKPLGKQVQLTVSDNGIGIPAHELPRIFDRGFTGSNGRVRGGSTGMGLYLCRKLADCLELQLQISSQPAHFPDCGFTAGSGSGTCITLTFPAVHSSSD
ncbi:MAG: HAMP domain-containing histidine kinase [Lachnospiraceae bacterium]|nr:HAMP domain-containing histidine kinase [Lachnospiraceae bacterium]